MDRKQKIDEMINVINQHATSYTGGKEISSRVVYALKQTPRHKFVENLVGMIDPIYPYEDSPIQIGYGQTMSQPFIVAYMTEMLELQPLHKVLEIGMGSGYQAAVLSELVEEIYTVERIPELAQRTKQLFETLEDYESIKIKIGNGIEGWKEHAPYDRIIVTATSQELVPPIALLEQLVVGGKMIMPIRKSAGNEELVLITKKRRRNLLYEGGVSTEKLIGVRFVPLVSE